MKIIMIEATAEELRANRTVMDTINDAFRNFTSNLCGINNLNFNLPVEEILGEDIDLDDFAMLVQDAVQVYRKNGVRSIGTVK